MMQFRYLLLTCILFIFFASEVACADDVQNKLTGDAARILNQYCDRCHRGNGSSAGRYSFNARDAESMVDANMVVAGDLNESQLLNAVAQGRMPPKNQAGLPRPSADEVTVIREWIQQGAPKFPQPQRRSFLSLTRVMSQIFEHFQNLDPRDRSTYRYFTLANLYNDPGADDRHLCMTRAAIAKALHSLSCEAKLVVPAAIDVEQTIYPIDIRKLGWDREHWAAIADEYPYEIDVAAITDHGNGDAIARLQGIEHDIAGLSRNDDERSEAIPAYPRQARQVPYTRLTTITSNLGILCCS